MLDISVSATKVRGRPKGRPENKPNKHSDQIIYPYKIIPMMAMKLSHWITGSHYRKSGL